MNKTLINSCACYGSNDLHECYCNLNNINMEAKEKAKELIRRYYRDSDLLVEDLSWIQAKECALIAVDEICEAIHYHYDDSTDIEWKYWQQVKREIDNL